MIGKVGRLLREHETDLATFLTVDPRGRQLPEYLNSLAGHVAGEQTEAIKELE
jgi:hypothetical protein